MIWLTVALVFLRASCFNIPISLGVYYGWFALIAIYFLIRPIRFNAIMVYFLIVAIFSILINNPADFYKPWQRLTSFVLMVICVGPLFVNNYVLRFRFFLYKVFNFLLIAISLGSFVGYCLQLPFCFGRSGFNGLLYHSMLLAPVAGISSLISLSMYCRTKTSLQKNVYLCSLIVSILTCLLAASRGALLALLLSIGAYLYLVYRHNQWKLIEIVLISFFVIGISSSLWMPYASNLIEKQARKVASDALLSGREQMWEDRIADFVSSPVYGVGFVSMENIDNSKVEMEEGTVEPGSGWLFILSTMGILGFLLLGRLIVWPVYSIYKYKYGTDSHYPLIAVVLIFFSLHLGIEGYVLSSGNFLFFYLWLCIGLVQIESLNLCVYFNLK